MDKPAGVTSHDVVHRVRRVLGIGQVGHTGTLDPFATGLLILLLGRATRLARFLDRQSKYYLATARLGTQTETDDLTGAVIAESAAWEGISRTRLIHELSRLEGEQMQRPPQYSAKQVGGERSYRRARRGEVADLEPARVTVHRIELLEYRPPEVTFRVEVSTGTYIRALARDLGERLGVGAHLTALRREAIGSLRVENAVSLERLGPDAIIPPQAVLPDLPQIELDPVARNAVAHGRAVVDGREAGKRGSGEAVALLSGNDLLAIARTEDGWLRPTVVLEVP